MHENKSTARNPVLVGALVLAVAAAYWPDSLALGRYWMNLDLNSQHGALIAVLTLWLLYRSRFAFAGASVRPLHWACVPLIACGAASLLFWRAGILTLQLFFLPPILWLSLLSVLGLDVARIAAFPVAFLYFGLPGWGLLGPTLQQLTISAVGTIGPMVGLPISISGTTAALPGGVSFSILPPCSGIDFLTIGLAVAALIGEVEHASLRRRAMLLGAMALVALVSNWLRVLLIIAIGYETRMRSALATTDHLALGWVVFACALLVFVWASTAKLPAAKAAEGTGTAARTVSSRPIAALRFRSAAALGALVAVPALIYATSLRAGGRLPGITLQLPSGRPPWRQSIRPPNGLWQPIFVGVHSERRASYSDGTDRLIEVMAIGYKTQAQGQEILNEGNSLLGNGGLSVEATAVASESGIPLSEVVAVDRQGRRSVIWSVIDIGGHLFAQPVYSQLWYGMTSLVREPYSVLFALRTSCGISCNSARGALASFLRANASDLLASVPSSQSSNAVPGPT